MRSRAVLHQPARSPTPHGQSTVEGCGLKTPDTGCLVGSLPGFTRVVSVGWLFLEQGRGDQTLTAGPFFDRIIEAPAPLRSSPHFYQGSDKHKQLCRPAGGETEAPRWPTAHPGKGRTLQTPAPPAPSPHPRGLSPGVPAPIAVQTELGWRQTGTAEGAGPGRPPLPGALCVTEPTPHCRGVCWLCFP